MSGLDGRPLIEARKKLLEQGKTFRDAMRLELFRALSILEAQIIQNIRQTFTVRTGALMNSVPRTKTIQETKDELIGQIGADTPYARIHEKGGMILPRNARFLKFPHPDNRRADGSASIDSIPKARSVLLPLRKGDGYLALERVGKERLEPRFILKDKVQIPARPYVAPALEKRKDELRRRFERLMGEHFGGE